MSRRPSREPASGRAEGVLKWVGRITAILSLVFAVVQLVRLVSDVRERGRQIDELTRTESLQRQAGDYPAAWATLERALTIAEGGGQLAKMTGQLSSEARSLRQAQEDLAMSWLQNLHLAPGATYASVTDKLTPVLMRGAADASGARKADLLAHAGWAAFYKSLGGAPPQALEAQYRAALTDDPGNPFAHAFLGHWLFVEGKSTEAALAEFDAALASGRARPFVRLVEGFALRRRGDAADAALIRMLNDMRVNGEPIEPALVHDADGIYWFACGARENSEALRRLTAAVPADQQVATFRALFYDASGVSRDSSKALSRDGCLATLTEAAGDRQEALRIWQRVRQTLPSKDRGTLAERADSALRRLGGR